MLLIRAENADRFLWVRHCSKRFLCVNLIDATQQPSLPYHHLTNDKSEMQDQQLGHSLRDSKRRSQYQKEVPKV